jgi:MFS family permease
MGRRRNVTIDYAGAVVLTLASTTLVLACTWGGVEYEWGSPAIIGLGIVAVIAALLFVRVERRAVEPLLPLRLFRVRTFTLSCSIGLLLGAGMYGVIVFLPVFLQTVNADSASDSGLLLIPLMLGLIGASVIAGQVVTETGRYRAFPILGTAILTIGVFLISRLDASSGSLQPGLFMLIAGIGVGFMMQIIVLATQNEVPAPDLGIATSAVNFFRAIGGSVGVALMGALFTSRLTTSVSAEAALNPAHVQELTGAAQTQYISDFAHALAGTFLFVVPLAALAIVLSLCLRESPLRQHVHTDAVAEIV